MLKLFAFALLVANVSAFWQSCNIPGVLTPDHIVSPVCQPGAARCQVTRGQVLEADAFFTPQAVHHRMDATATAHHLLLLGGSLNVSANKLNLVSIILKLKFLSFQ